MLERGHLAQSGTSGLFWVFSNFWNQNKMVGHASKSWPKAKTLDFYAFPFAMRPSGANANAQLILPRENFVKKNSDKF